MNDTEIRTSAGLSLVSDYYDDSNEEEWIGTKSQWDQYRKLSSNSI